MEAWALDDVLVYSKSYQHVETVFQRLHENWPANININRGELKTIKAK